MKDRYEYHTRVTDIEMIRAMRILSTAVDNLSSIYDKDPSLNHRFDIEKLVPMSLDEWYVSLGDWVDHQIQALPSPGPPVVRQ